MEETTLLTKEALEALTVKDLQAKLVEFGYTVEDAEGFKTRAPLVSSILREQSRGTKVVEAPTFKNETADSNDLGVREIEESKKHDTEDKVEPVKSINERLDPTEERHVNKAWKSKAEIMKYKLLGQELVSIIVPPETNEKEGVVIWVWSRNDEYIPDEEWRKLSLDQKMLTHQVWVSGAYISPQLNGYKFFVPKGKYYRVPLQVASVITDSQQQTLDAGKHIELDRVDPRTGRSIKEML